MQHRRENKETWFIYNVKTISTKQTLVCKIIKPHRKQQFVCFSACKAQKCRIFMVSTEFESVSSAISLFRHTILCFRELERMSKQCSRDQFALRPAFTVISQQAFGPGNEKRLAALHIIKNPTNGRSLVIIWLCA